MTREHCPAANICSTSMSGDSGPECGTVGEHLPPLPVAEQLCLRAATGIQTLLTYDNTNDYTVNQSLGRLAWQELELAMNPALSTDEADDHFAKAEDYADTVLETDKATLTHHIGPGLLRSYLPLFEQRRSGYGLAVDNIRLALQGVGDLFDSLMAAKVHPYIMHPGTFEADHTPCVTSEDKRRGSLAKMAFLMLAARQGILLYPASDRESHSRADPRLYAHTNHDAYMLDGNFKTPIRIRFQAQSSKWGAPAIATETSPVLQFRLRSMIAEVLREEYGRKQTVSSEVLNELTSTMPLLVRRAFLGESLNRDQQHMLAGVTAIFIRETKARRRAANLKPLWRKEFSPCAVLSSE